MKKQLYMKAFKEQFQAPSRQQWLEKAEKELKGKPLSELSWQIDENLSVPPIFFEGDVDPSFTTNSLRSNWTIGDKYTISTPSQTNKDLLAALNMGLEGAHLVLNTALSKTEWAKLFDQIILSYITLIIDASTLGADSLLGLAEYLAEADWDKKQLFVFTEDGTECPPLLQDCVYTKSTFSVATDDSVQQLHAQIKRAESRLQSQIQNGQAAAPHFFQITLSRHFYLNIIYAQALHIIWQNILDANDIDPHTPFYIQGIIAEDAALDENTQKINATVQAVSAIVAGIDYLQIETAEKSSNEAFNRRINRNIQHLLKLESFMDHVENPSAGAYYFDALTKEFAEKVWEKFTNS